MQKLMRRGRRIATGGVLSGALAAAMAISEPSGSVNGAGGQPHHRRVGLVHDLQHDAGARYVVQRLPRLLHDATVAGPLRLSVSSCASSNGGNQVGLAYTENPINDVATEEPALGSSAGVQQLEYGGTGSDGATPANPTAVVNYARSSRANKTSDYPGLNFVAYATDGVSFLTFPEVNGKASPSAKVKNLSITQLSGIFTGKITNWDKVGGTTRHHLCLRGSD